jgi:hypothetical protein
MPIEPITAAAAVALVVPYLAKAAEAGAEKAGEATAAAAGKVLEWMREKLTGRAREALGDVENAPNDADNQADLRKQLSKALEADRELEMQLKLLLPGSSVDGGAMTQSISGEGAKAAQVRGSGNTTTIS